MGFSQSVADEVLIRCGRHCCLCGQYAGQKMELHHIKQVADGGKDTAENCIPLCLNCHAEVNSYNPRHPKGRKFTEAELKGHREKYYALFSGMAYHSVKDLNNSSDEESIFAMRQNTTPVIWGYCNQDKQCPLMPGALVLIAGYTGTRKSTYVQHVVNSNLWRGQRIVYCCLKDSPIDVGHNIIAEDAAVNVSDLRRGKLTEEEWKRITYNKEAKGENLVLFSYDELANGNKIISIVESSGAEIVVVDDINGLFCDDSVAVERWMYQLKNAANKSGAVVFVIYNMSSSKKRVDIRPVLEDFPSDSYYRLFDIVQFMFRPSTLYGEDDFDTDILEAIFVKGPTTGVIEMHAPDRITRVFSYEKST